MAQLRSVWHRLWVHVQWSLFTLLAFLLALWLAWQLLASVNFLYPWWYELIGIDQTITTYGPRNHYRHQFESTTKAERVRLFAAIVAAIQQHGKGLDTLVYHAPDGRPIAPLLTPPEITHLQDVARLVDSLLKLGWGALSALPVLLGLLLKQKLPMPSVTRLLLTATMVGVGTGGWVLLMGPVKVFYTLHTWIFPAGHAWFFYYEDSLMTLLMQAPVIFAYIAASLAVLSLLLFTGLLLVANSVYRHLLRALSTNNSSR
jgi:hypothetical protein